LHWGRARLALKHAEQCRSQVKRAQNLGLNDVAGRREVGSLARRVLHPRDPDIVDEDVEVGNLGRHACCESLESFPVTDVNADAADWVALCCIRLFASVRLQGACIRTDQRCL
jgi:hypothetical protein